MKAAETYRAMKRLKAVPKVASVEVMEKINGSTRLLVRPVAGEFIAEAVGAAMQDANLATTDMFSLIGTLDDVFRSVTTNQSR